MNLNFMKRFIASILFMISSLSICSERIINDAIPDLNDLSEKIYKVLQGKDFYNINERSLTENQDEILNSFISEILDLDEFQIMFVGNEKVARIIVLNQLPNLRTNKNPKDFLTSSIKQIYKQYINICYKKSSVID